MQTNLDRYKEDLESLLKMGDSLALAMQNECSPEQFKRVVKEEFADKAEVLFKNLPDFKEKYQSWYSEALVLVKQLLPDRFSDFVRHYEKPKPRKEITYERGSFKTRVCWGLFLVCLNEKACEASVFHG
jgi:hypothetical protein